MLQESAIFVGLTNADNSPVNFAGLTPNPRQIALGPRALYFDTNASPRIFWNLKKDNSLFEQTTGTGGGGGGGVWGSITGTLSNQTDLVAALAGKYPVPGGSTAQYVRGDGSLATFPAFGTGDMVLANVQTNTGAKTFADGTLLLGGSTSGAATLHAPAVAGSISYTMPAASDTLVGRATTDTLLGKTFDTAGSGNVFKIAGVGISTVTGTGAACLANSPAFTTPNLGTPSAGNLSSCTNIPSSQLTGLATNMLAFLQGGTSAQFAAAVTDEDGTGTVVLSNSPSITTPTLTGIVTTDGANVTTANAMGGLAVDVTKGLNTKSVAADSTFTFSGTPAANTWFAMRVTNTDTNPHTLTIPSSFSLAMQAARTTVVVPASGKLTLLWVYDGTTYILSGDTGYANNWAATTNPGTGNDITQGYGPGSFWGNTSSNVAYWCESAATGAAVWNAFTGSGSGDMLLGTAQTVTAAKTFNDATLVLAGATSGTSTIKAAAVAGSTIFTLPGTTDTLAGLAATQGFTNKTYNGNTLTAGTWTLTGGAGKTLTFSNSITLAGTDGTTMTMPSVSSTLSAQPTISSISAAYTFALADGLNNVILMHPSADTTARTWTIPANASVAFPVGTLLHVKNQLSAGTLTIAITTDTLTKVGAAGGTGSRTLAAGGEASILKVDATHWEIVGTAELT